MYGKVIENIEPFNEAWYINCVYQLMFVVIRHFGKSIDPMLLNDIFVYELSNNNEEINFEINTSNINPSPLLFEDMGIGIDYRFECDDIVGFSTEAIDNGRPIILFIDSYHEPIRTDAYMKRHIAHSILLYGYDDFQEQFNILESKYHDSFEHEKMLIDFQDAVNCHKGYMSEYHTGSLPSLYSYYYKSDRVADVEKYRAIFFEAMKANKDKIYRGLDSLKEFSSIIEGIIRKAHSDEKSIANIVSMFYHIVNKKVAETYRYRRLFSDMLSDKFPLLDQIVNDFNFVRNAIGKIEYTKDIDQRYLEEAVKRLGRIHQRELELNDYFIQKI